MRPLPILTGLVLMPAAPALLVIAQGAWAAMREATCTLEASTYRGDPAGAAVADRCRARMARARTEDLRQFGEVN